jgi:hypothetical protein
VPVGERKERRGAGGRREPDADEERAATEAVGRETDRYEASRRDDVAHAEDETDVGRRRAKVAQVQGKERAEKAEPDAPEDLGTGEGGGLLAEA